MYIETSPNCLSIVSLLSFYYSAHYISLLTKYIYIFTYSLNITLKHVKQEILRKWKTKIIYNNKKHWNNIDLPISIRCLSLIYRVSMAGMEVAVALFYNATMVGTLKPDILLDSYKKSGLFS